MFELNNIISERLHHQAICISSDDNAEELVVRIRLMEDDSKDGLQLVQQVSQDLMQTTLKGVSGIKRAIMRQCDDSGWMLETEGSNLREALSVADIDFTRTTSNHVMEVLACLGVEAARFTLLKEMRKVIEFDGAFVNYRHLSVLCDSMTRGGSVMPITRHGINR